MTLSTLDSVARYAGDGSTREFTFPRRVVAVDDLQVRLIGADGSVSTPSVTKSLVPPPPASGPYTAKATFEIGSEPPSGSTVVLWRAPALIQETNVATEGDTLAALNRALDRLYGVLQDERNQGLRVPPWTTQEVDTSLPLPEANALLAWNATADGLTNAGSTVAISLSNGDVVADTMRITVTAKDANDVTVEGVHEFVMHMSEASTGIGLTADNYSGDLTATTGAIIGALTAKKAWVIQTAATGIWAGKLVDSARPSDQYVVVKKPLGVGVVVSASSSGKWSTGA